MNEVETPDEVKASVRNVHPGLLTMLRRGLEAVPEGEDRRVGERRFTRRSGTLMAIARIGGREYEVAVDDEGALALAAGHAHFERRVGRKQFGFVPGCR